MPSLSLLKAGWEKLTSASSKWSFTISFVIVRLRQSGHVLDVYSIYLNYAIK